MASKPDWFSGVKMARTVWYPGHMAKGKRQMAALSGHLDLLLEVRDARAPRLTESPMLGDFPPSLEIWTVLSKADLADPEATSEWLDEFKRRKRMAWALDLRKGVPGSVKKAILLSAVATSRWLKTARFPR